MNTKIRKIENMDIKNLSPKQYQDLKLTDVVNLPFTAKNGIRFTPPDLVPYLGNYCKGNCEGTIQLDNCVFAHNVYGITIRSTAYWTKMFGDNRGSTSTYIDNQESTESILNRVAEEIEKRYKEYHKF